MKSVKHIVRSNISLWQKIPNSDYDWGCQRIVRPVQFPIISIINAILNKLNNLIINEIRQINHR
jgi:hypothetical protein